jgi:hypothetical protein
MRRREFITLFGGAATWPFVARAQQPERMRRIGVLVNRAEDDPDGQARLATFQQALQQLGWSDGNNVRLDIRWHENDADPARRYAQELVALAPDILLASGLVSLAALRDVTRTLPIVFAGGADPVGAGFVDTLARPGGNITGFMFVEYGFSGKWLELLKQIAPQVTRAAVIRNAENPSGVGEFGAIQAVAPSVGVEVSPIGVHDTGEIERAVATFARSANGGLRRRLRHRKKNAAATGLRARRAPARGYHFGRKSRWIHHFDRWRPDEINPQLSEHGNVGVQRSGIPGEVLLRRELCRVDENRDDGALRATLCGTYQRKMARVQRSHGRHQRNIRVARPPGHDGSPQGRYRAQDAQSLGHLVKMPG